MSFSNVAYSTQTTWEKPADFVERKSPAKPQPSVEASNETEGEAGIKEAVSKETTTKTGSKRFLGLFSKSMKKSEATNRSTSRKSRPPNSNLIGQTSISNDAAEVEANRTNQLVSDLNDACEVHDFSSVSSEETLNSIFSAKKVKKVLGKVGSKIAGKINSSPTNASYGALNDSFSQKKDSQDSNNKSVDLSVEVASDVKQQPSSSEAAPVKPTPQTKEASDTNEVNPASDKKKSRWRSAIDPQTGRTYYFHKDTQETVWEKPANF